MNGTKCLICVRCFKTRDDWEKACRARHLQGSHQEIGYSATEREQGLDTKGVELLWWVQYYGKGYVGVYPLLSTSLFFVLTSEPTHKSCASQR